MQNERASGGPANSPGYEPSAYGDRLAAEYDILYPPDCLETEAAVDLIDELTRLGRTRSFLEFGIGTGRLALGVRQRGVRVAGIESSENMIAVLHKKASPAEIEVVHGDYVSAGLDRKFSVVAIVFNNIFDPAWHASTIGPIQQCCTAP